MYRMHLFIWTKWLVNESQWFCQTPTASQDGESFESSPDGRMRQACEELFSTAFMEEDRIPSMTNHYRPRDSGDPNTTPILKLPNHNITQSLSILSGCQDALDALEYQSGRSLDILQSMIKTVHRSAKHVPGWAKEIVDHQQSVLDRASQLEMVRNDHEADLDCPEDQPLEYDAGMCSTRPAWLYANIFVRISFYLINWQVRSLCTACNVSRTFLLCAHGHQLLRCRLCA